MEDAPLPDSNDAEAQGLFLKKQRQIFGEVMPLAMRNLAIAENLDRQRYRRVRGSGWDRPKPSFKVGEYVLVGRQTKGSLDIVAHPGVLQVPEVWGLGVLELWGSDGVRTCEQVKNMAHYPVQVLDPIVDTKTMVCVVQIHCRECGRRGDEKRMVLCDTCNEGYHQWCVISCLYSVPDGF